MKDISLTSMGNLVTNTVYVSMLQNTLQNTHGNYDLGNYISNFDRTQEEPDISLIKSYGQQLAVRTQNTIN